MEEIHKLRAQVGNIVRVNFPASDPKTDTKLPPPSEFQLKVLRQLLAASFVDQVAVRKDRIGADGQSKGVQFANAKGVPYRAAGILEDVFIHPSSVLVDLSPPEFVMFHELVRTSRPYMKGIYRPFMDKGRSLTDPSL
jgi:ATP-dependent RNA helicase DHX37/DHR1